MMYGVGCDVWCGCDMWGGVWGDVWSNVTHGEGRDKGRGGGSGGRYEKKCCTLQCVTADVTQLHLLCRVMSAGHVT